MPDHPITPEILDSVEFKEAVSAAVTSQTSQFQTSISELEKNNAKLLGEKREVETKISELHTQFEGIDVEAVKAMQRRLQEVDNDETRALLAQGEFDKVYEKKFSQLTGDHENTVATLQAEHDTALKTVNTERDNAVSLAQELQNTLVITVRDGGISQAFVSSDAEKTQLRGVKAIAKDTVLVKGEWLPVVSVDKDGKSQFRHSQTGELLQNGNGDFGYDDWLNHLADNEGLPLFSKPNSHSDANLRTDANPKGLSKSKMTDEEKRAFKAKHGIKAYDALPLGKGGI